MVKGEDSTGELDFQFSIVGASEDSWFPARLQPIFQKPGRPAPVQVRSASESSAGVNPRKFRGNAVENSALPRGKVGVTLWNSRGMTQPDPPIFVMQEDRSGPSF
jgi:hypothetical protein